MHVNRLICPCIIDSSLFLTHFNDVAAVLIKCTGFVSYTENASMSLTLVSSFSTAALTEPRARALAASDVYSGIITHCGKPLSCTLHTP